VKVKHSGVGRAERRVEWLRDGEGLCDADCSGELKQRRAVTTKLRSSSSIANGGKTSSQLDQDHR